jgi:hypothetical protein
MGGLGLLILLCGYIWLVFRLIRAVKQAYSNFVVVAIALLVIALPFVDAIVGRIALHNKCEAEGQIIINEKVQNVEGIGVQYGVFKDSPAYYGYQYIEGGFVYNSPWMLERAQLDGSANEVVIEKNIQPKAKYLLHEGLRQDSAYFYKTRISIREIATNRELSGFNWFAFRGGLVERVAMAFSDAGPSGVATCGSSENMKDKEMEMLHKTLQSTLARPSNNAP